jgi:ribose transport system substrate-binding protein
MRSRKFIKTILAAAATATALTVALTGCSLSSTGASTTSTTSATSQKLISTKGMKVGVVVETLSLPLIKAWGDTIVSEGKTFGWTVTVQDGNRNAATQTSQVEAYIAQKVNLIVLQATDAAALSPAVTKAEKAGIPVITMNQNVDAAHTAFVGMGHYGMGVQAGEAMAKAMGGKGNVVVLDGVVATTASRERIAGLKASFKKYPGIKIVAEQPANFDRKTAYDVFTTIMRGQKSIQGVFGANDEEALGAGQAAVDAGRKSEMTIWGADGSADMYTGIRNGVVDGDSAVDSYIIPKTIAYLAQFILSGGVGAAKYNSEIDIPPFVVTKANVNTVPAAA